MKFLDVRTDFAFKKVFGSTDSKERLISFLNSIVYRDSGNKITDLDIVDPYNIPKLKGMKDTYVDVKAILMDKTTVIIEMQVLNHQGFETRILYNAAKNYSMQLVKGERYDLLKPVIALNIVDFDMFNDNEELINYFKMINKKDFTDYHDDIELIFVELNKFTKKENECQTNFDKWLYFLKNAGDMNFIPQDLPEPIKSAYSVSNEAGMNAEELELQHKKREFIAINRGSLTLAKKQGMSEGMVEGIELGVEQGIEQGIEKGVEQNKLGMAWQMKKEGMDHFLISKITRLSLKEIESLVDKG